MTADGVEAPAAQTGGTRRIAINSILQAGADAAGKIGLLVLYAVMSREAGLEALGDFTSAASLGVMIMIAAFGMDFRVTRLVARGDDGAGEAYWGAMLLKGILGVLILGIVLVVGIVGPYADRVVVVTGFLGLAFVVELTMLTPHAVFRGLERLGAVATALVLYRVTLSIVGTVLLMTGAPITAVAVTWLACALLALTYSFERLRAAGIRYPVAITRSGLRAVGADSIGLGLAAVFGAALSRVDILILGFLKDSTSVALYGGAYRVIESMQFLTAALALASFPTLTRLSRTSTPTIGDASALAIKVMIVVTAPIAVVLTVCAGPILRAIYGGDFGDGTRTLEILGPIVLLAALTSLMGYILTSQRRQRPIVIALAGATVTNVVANFVLIPPHGPAGAAAAMVATMLVMLVLFVPALLSVTGRLSPWRLFAGPTLATAAMVGVAILCGAGLVSVVPATVAFVLVLLGYERVAHPADAQQMLGVLRIRRAR